MRDTCSQGGFVKIFKALGAPGVVEADRRSRAMGDFDAGYMRVGEPVEYDE